MRRAPRQDTYLPTSQDRALSIVLAALRRDPGDDRSLGEWASVVHSTERTLSRRCQRDLGMPFVECRQRLRLVQALSMLQDGLTVQTVALEMGYSTSSAFIAMFHRMTRATPDDFRKRIVQASRGSRTE
ncbi:helix-turn-helix domain-containing protein [Rhizobium mongolense]|uniref:helix-turn-helix domain-containing protein n=1 Tax=Rhizobium mongolense TaxID=57676 RepID=UPI0034A2236B